MNSSKPVADITLLLEGTYPYMTGGVSHWVHQLISGLPQFTFSLVFLGSTKDSYAGMRFTLPSNVTHLQSLFLWESNEFGSPRACSGDREYFGAISRLHEWFRFPQDGMDRSLTKKILLALANPNGTAVKDFLFSEASWDFICERYSCSSKNRSEFTDYFWTVRLTHAPLLKLAQGATSIPPTRAIHSVSNGYAGFLGTVLHHLTGRPFVLTEHGIYAKERKIDLQCVYIQEHQDYLNDPPLEGMKDHHFLWIRHFEALSRFVYSAANPILSCHGGNRRRQIREGAERERTRVIPNGINLKLYIPLRAKRPAKIPLVLGLIGRMVPIKDIKTFIRAMRAVATQLPAAEGWLIGPEDEDPKYGQECKQLVANLGLENNVRFLGFQDLDVIFPQLGLLVLTSISEAFPLVLLEAFATGLPVLTTDVGACREIIEGNTQEDKALGCAGSVVPIANPEATANAALALLADEKRWLAAQRAAIARVERYYSELGFLESYGEVYQTAVEF
ncbi:MAG: GT4 family glycosyltransferase PelF [Gammaproteobacteria bacterium]